ncbi:MAG TPA: TetR/AcrR family transcriptional regulator [Kofleriaceae bacterium]
MNQPAYSRLPRERRVADIMKAAREVFDEKGYDDASVAEIAERAGVVEGSVYRYFEHKRALLVEVVERWYEELLSDYDEHVSVITGTWDRLRYLVWKHLSTIEKEPMLVRLVFEELRPGADYRRTDVFELNRAYTKRTLDILEEGVVRGEIRGDVSLAMARDMIYGGVEHHTWAYVRGEGKFDPVTAADAIIEILKSGIGKPHVQKSPRRKSR